MKKTEKMLFVLFIIAAIAILVVFIKNSIEPASVTLIKDEEKIKEMINQKYPDYSISELELNYVDWSSTVREANGDHKATEAMAIIENENEERTIHLRKKFNNWNIESDEPNYGPSVPDEQYFIEIIYEHVGKSINIDEQIKKYWIIPDDDGNPYIKEGKGEDWYYTFKYCRNIYKTDGGKVYVFNKEKSDWEICDVTYSDLRYLSNYDDVDPKYGMELIKNYSK